MEFVRTNQQSYNSVLLGQKTQSSICYSVFFIVSIIGLEPIAVEVSGGHFLQPVQTLVATIICSQREQMYIESNKESHLSPENASFRGFLRRFCLLFRFLRTFEGNRKVWSLPTRPHKKLLQDLVCSENTQNRGAPMVFRFLNFAF